MNKARRTFGWICFILSNLFWGCVYFMPFSSLTTKHKILLGSVFAVTGETLFWISVILLGKEYIKKIKGFLSPSHWFLKK